MKRIPTLFILFLYWICGAFGQVTVKNGLYFNPAGRQIWITEMDGAQSDRALLYKVSKDSVFYVKTGLKKLDPDFPFEKVQRIHLSQIKSITTLHHSPGKKGALIGGLSGTLGGILLYTSSINELQEEPVLGAFLAEVATSSPGVGIVYGLGGASLGAGIGALIGKGAKKTWEINGQKSAYDQRILDLDKRAFWRRTK